jgi:hypothetical protein
MLCVFNLLQLLRLLLRLLRRLLRRLLLLPQLRHTRGRPQTVLRIMCHITCVATRGAGARINSQPGY